MTGQQNKRRASMRKSMFLILIVAVAMISCNGSVFEVNKDIGSDGWHMDSVYVFKTDSLTNLPQAIEFGFNLRNTIDYKYRNLNCYLTVKLPNGRVLKDTINHNLLSPEGYWLDHVKGGNSIKESSIVFTNRLNNPDPGVYEISIQHGMRENYLEDVISVSGYIKEFVNQ